jgi:Tfp pilus assembly protein PilE
MIELTIVVLIVGILISITVPAYLGLQARAQQGAAMSTVRASVSGVESFYADNGSFTGISPTVLKTYDSTLDTSSIQVIATSGGNSYMMCSKNGPYYGYKLGPAASVLSDTTAPTGCTL